MLIEDALLGSVLWPLIRDAREKKGLNIIESPSLGALAVPADITQLIRDALQVMLDVSRGRGSTKVCVMCTRQSLHVLELRVADNGGEYDLDSQFKLSLIGEQAGKFGGVLGMDWSRLNMAVWLTVPLPTS